MTKKRSLFSQSALGLIRPEQPETFNQTEGDINYNDLTVAQLKELLDERGVEYASDAKKADLIALLEEGDVIDSE